MANLITSQKVLIETRRYKSDDGSIEVFIRFEQGIPVHLSSIGEGINSLELDLTSKPLMETLKVFNDILNDNKPRTFTISEIEHLQSEVFEITGEGSVMKLFNKLLGVNAG